MAVATETPIAAAMHRAGYDTNKARLNTVACDALRKAKLNPQLAGPKFIAAVRADKGLLLALIGDEWLGQFAQEYLEARASDMRGTERGETGHGGRVTQTSAARSPRQSSEGDEAKGELSPAYPVPLSSEAGRDDGGQVVAVSAHTRGAPASRPSTLAVAAAAKVAKQEAESVWGFKLAAMGMVAIGDIPLAGIERGLYTAGRERVVLRVLKAYRDHKVAPDGIPGRVVRDVMTEDQAKQVIEFAARSEKRGIEYHDDAVLLETALGISDG